MGALTSPIEACRDARGLTWLDDALKDVRYAGRTLRGSATLTATIVAVLALGIGASTTIFAFANAVLLRPLPYPSPDRIVVLHERALDAPAPLNVHPQNFVEWRSRAGVFEALVLVQTPPLNVMGAEGAEQVSRMMATSDLFRVFGVVPALGRGFIDADTRPGGPQVAVLGYAFWQRWFGGDPGVLGRELRLPAGSLTVIGVAPRGFKIGGDEPAVFTPLVLDPANPGAAGSRAFQCYGRLDADVTLAGAQGEMTAIAASLRQVYPIDKDMGVVVSSLHEYLSREARPALHLMLGVVLAVLAIAGVNIAGLLMARSTDRRAEFALRVALGARRGRLVRQVVTESLLLSLAGGLAGVALAWWLTHALSTLAALAFPVDAFGAVTLDAWTIVCAFGTSVVIAVAFGLVPAIEASHTQPDAVLRAGGRGASADRHTRRARFVLVIAQVAVSVVLLVGAGLLLRTLVNLTRLELGFEPARTLTMGVFLGVRPPEARIAALDAILGRVASVPGVVAAGTIQFPPLRGMTCGTGFWHDAQAGARSPADSRPTSCGLVSRGYFAAMGIPVLAGRDFAETDRPSSPRVVIVDRTFARKYFPGRDAIGQRILVDGSNASLAEIVGIVGEVRHSGLMSEPIPTVYALHAQSPGYITTVVVRTSGDAGAMAGAIRRAIHDADPLQAVSAVSTVEEDVAKVLARPRLQAWLVAGAALLSIVLATVGVYGLVAHVIAQQRREFAIRVALGATRGLIAEQVLWQGGRLVCAGVVAGVVGAVAAGRLASSYLFGITSRDPLTYAVAIVVTIAAAMLAVAVVARRAAHVDPSRALRSS